MEVKDIILTADIDKELKALLFDIATEVEISEYPKSNKKYHIKPGDPKTTLHELLHIALGHLTERPDKSCSHCLIENIIKDIIVEKLLKNSTEHLERKLAKLYKKKISHDHVGLLTIDCKYCSVTKGREAKSKNRVVSNIEKELEKVIQSVTKKTFVPIKNRNYRTSDFFVIEKKDLTKTIHLIIDSSTSIDSDIFEAVKIACEKIAKKLPNVKIYYFADIVSKNPRRVDVTRFSPVVEKFKNKDIVVVITDGEFDDFDIDRLSNNFKLVII